MALDSKITANSNTLLYNIRVQSNALEYHIRTESNALEYHIKNESNALVYGLRTLSSAIYTGIKNLSDAILQNELDIHANSQAIVFLTDLVNTSTDNIRYNSNTLLALTRFNSQAIIYITEHGVDGELSRVNSNLLVQLNNEVNDFVYEDHKIIQSGNIISGLARFNAGFTIPAGGSATLDSCLSVSGGFDLQESGQLNLRGNLRLDGNTTITSGGTLYGQYTGLILDGDLTLAAGKVLHISGNTFIDGHEHNLVVENNAQIFVDTNATLTLRNVFVHNGQHTLSTPPIKLAATTSKLALDSAALAPSNNFLFPQGQLFVHNDVQFTGTSAFIYTSPVPSWIASQSCLLFDHGTTFSVAPATFTDAPYALSNTYTDCNFIKMADRTSKLYFNGCSLATTQT